MSAYAGAAGSWRGSWAVGLRMARREVRRHRGRRVLALLMVAVPTALLVFALTLYPTSLITGAERIPVELGNAVAVFDPPGNDQIVQDPEAIQAMPAGASADGPSAGETPPAKPLPGVGSADPPRPERLAAVLAQEFDGNVVATTVASTRILDGDRSRRVDLLSTTDPAARGAGLTLASAGGRRPPTRWSSPRRRSTTTCCRPAARSRWIRRPPAPSGSWVSPRRTARGLPRCAA